MVSRCTECGHYRTSRRCPECARRRARAWYAKNKAKGQAVRRAYYVTHKTEAIARAKKHAKENRELIQLRQRNYRESDPQKYSEYARQYRQKNAVRVANHKAKRRAVQAKVYVEYVDRAVALARENGRCYLCQKKITLKTMHLDRVVALVNGGEHSYANCRAACAKCNLRKGAR